jgi:hypothetical protein
MRAGAESHGGPGLNLFFEVCTLPNSLAREPDNDIGFAFQHMLGSKADSVISSGPPRTERAKKNRHRHGLRPPVRGSNQRFFKSESFKDGGQECRDSKVDPQFGTELSSSFIRVIASNHVPSF